MTYTRNIPITGDSLGGTRDRIRTNFQLINDDFAINHVAFNALGAGKHKFINQPDQVADVASAANEPVMYAKGTANAGVLQYSRGPSNAAPTPITALQSPGGVALANNTATPVLDFTGIPIAMGIIYAFDSMNTLRKCLAYVWWNGTVLNIENLVSVTSSIRAQVNGTTLELFNNNTSSGMTVYWTLDLKRTS